MSRKLLFVFAAMWASFVAAAELPYPVIFVHGINSDQHTWDSVNGALPSSYGLTGQVLDITLDYSLNYVSPTDSKEADVHLFTSVEHNDYYLINFDVDYAGLRRGGEGNNVMDLQDYINETETTFEADFFDALGATPYEMSQISSVVVDGDIIYIENEYMRVLDVTVQPNNSQATFTVQRGLYGSTPQSHSINKNIYITSNQSNQSSIEKQAYGLSLAINAILGTVGVDKVILVGHSMGGLAARCYAQHYNANAVAKLITIGTPNLGAVKSDIFADELVALIASIDPRSEAVRDLAYWYDFETTNTPQENGVPDALDVGVFLFGGNENSVPSNMFLNRDINSDGTEGNEIVGLNTEPLPTGFETYFLVGYARDFTVARVSVYNDGVVLLPRQWLDLSNEAYVPGNFIWDKSEPVLAWHSQAFESIPPYTWETGEIDQVVRALDEPDIPELAYDVQSDRQYSFCTTIQSAAQPELLDHDWFQFTSTARGHCTIEFENLQNPQSVTIEITDAEGALVSSPIISPNANCIAEFDTPDGESTYRVHYSATPTSTSWQQCNVISYNIVDVTPPFPVSDLTLFRNGLNGYVSWTATGDDGVEGRAVHALRMSTEPLTEFNFDNAMLLYQDEHLGGGINGAFFTFPFTDETYYIAMQVCDEAGNCSGLSNILTEYIPPREIPQGHQITAAECFIDTDPGPGNGLQLPITAGPSPFGNWMLPVSSLVHGVHQLYLRMRDDEGRWFSPMRRSFVVTAPHLTTLPTNVRAEISFDQEPNGTNDFDMIVAPDWEVVANLETSPSALDLGPHELYLRFVYNDTLISAPQRRSFRVTPPIPEGGQRIVAAEYFTDEDPGEGLGWLLVPDQGDDVIMAANFPADTMTPGMHELNLRVRSADGIWSSPARRSFHVGRSGSILADAEYFWDVDPGHGLGQTMDFSDAYDVALTPEVTVPELAPGVHSFSVRFRSLLGEWSGPARRSIHVRPEIPEGGYAISNAEAFVDTDPGVGQGIIVQASDGTLDEADEVLLRYASPIGLGMGDHAAYMRVQDNTGRWSTLVRDSFVVVPPVEVKLTVIADSLGDSLRLRWNAFPEALTYAIHWDTLTNGSFDNVIPVQPPDTLLVWPLDQSPKRFFYVTALLPDTTLVRQSFLQKAPANRRLP